MVGGCDPSSQSRFNNDNHHSFPTYKNVNQPQEPSRINEASSGSTGGGGSRNLTSGHLAANLSALVSLRTQHHLPQQMISYSLQAGYQQSTSRSPIPNAQQTHFQDSYNTSSNYLDVMPNRSVQHPFNNPVTPRSGMDFGFTDSQRNGGAGMSHGTPVPPSDANHPMHIRCKFGQMGNAPGMFNAPHGFCLGLNEEIIVADTYNHRIQVS